MSVFRNRLPKVAPLRSPTQETPTKLLLYTWLCKGKAMVLKRGVTLGVAGGKAVVPPPATREPKAPGSGMAMETRGD
jgi:hypothetical protein